MLVAVVRLLPGRACAPVRFLAIAYTDVFRGVPAVITIYLIVFGFALAGVPVFDSMSKDGQVFWLSVLALVLVYGAYVAEVYRAGLESIHWSQAAAARSLGLSQWQTMRHVVIPQAVRRIIPPLLNDFVALQKDTALVSFVGVVEILNYAGLYKNQLLQPLARHRRRDRVPDHHDPGDALRRLPHPHRQGTHAGPMSAFVELRDVHKRFGDNEVLRGVDLAVDEHQVVCLIGPSGCGKSTLLRCINALETIEEGEIHIDGERVSGPRRRRQRVARRRRHCVPELQPLPAHERARQRVARAAQGAQARPRRGRGARVRSCSTGSGSPTRRTSTPTGSPAANSSASPSCARSRCNHA